MKGEMFETNEIIFSIYVFIYRNVADLERTIQSVYEQNYAKMELIVSDDHSIEDCNRQYQIINKIIEPYKLKFDKVIINVNKENMGTVKHINAVLPLGTGKYVCLLGCGDGFYNSDVLQKIYYHFQLNDSLVCTSKRIIYLNEKKNVVLPNRRIVRYINKSSQQLLNLCCREVNYIVTIGTFFKREIFVKYEYFDETYYLMEDAPFFLKILLEGEKISFIDQITCFYARGGVSNRKKIDERLSKDSIRTLTEIKYPNRKKLGIFTRRVVSFKYMLRGSNDWKVRLKGCVFFPDALIFMVFFVIVDKISRMKYLE